MATGTVTIPRAQDVVREKLRGLLAAANCTVVSSSPEGLVFRHGTYVTQTASLFPKTYYLVFSEQDGITTVDYEGHVALPIQIWLTLWGILFCWTIIMPIVSYNALVTQPKRLIENLLAGI